MFRTVEGKSPYAAVNLTVILIVLLMVKFNNFFNLLQALTAPDKIRFEDMAKQDKVRYDREMVNYVPPKGMGKRGKKKKDPNAPKRPP